MPYRNTPYEITVFKNGIYFLFINPSTEKVAEMNFLLITLQITLKRSLFLDQKEENYNFQFDRHTISAKFLALLRGKGNDHLLLSTHLKAS